MASDILRPTIEYHGLFATHNMPCAVCRQRPAVLQINDDVFMPCWECRERWELRPRSWWSRLFMANVLVALSIVGTAIGLLFTDYPSWWHGVWFGALGLSVLLSFVLPPLVEVIRPARSAGEVGQP